MPTFCVLVTAVSMSLRAQVATGVADFTSLSLEELGSLSISAASKREQPLFETPSAVSVVLPRDLERHGFGSVADALRLVPGVHVAQGNNSRWAVGIRGFNGLTSTKLLVLVDGRTVYSPYYAGVDWVQADIHAADLARVEVVRGPGATLWGANAVNGIVNILSKDARETQGGIAVVRTGAVEDLDAYWRYGGRLGERTWYRVFARARSTDASPGSPPDDNWLRLLDTRAGWRADTAWSDSTQLTWQGEIYSNRYRSPQLDPGTGTTSFGELSSVGANLLGRLHWRGAHDDQLTVQMYADVADGRSRGFVGGLGENASNIAEDSYNLDLDVTHHTRPVAGHDLVWGGGMRRTFMDLELDGSIIVQRPRLATMLYNVFAQDEITLVPERLQLTLGTKLEHHDSVGWQSLPSARLSFTPVPDMFFWAAVSRAIRSPSRSENDSRFTYASFPASPSSPAMRIDLVGTPLFTEEVLVAWEVGGRWQPSPTLTFEATAYVHDYDRLRNLAPSTTFEPTPPTVITELLVVNGLAARGHGAELAATWRVRDSWHLAAHFTTQCLDPEGTFEPTLIGADFAIPRNMASLTSWWELPSNVEFSCGWHRVGAVPALGGERYDRIDAQITWRPRLDVKLSLGVQNALDGEHREYSALATFASRTVPRSVFAGVEWKF